MREAKPSDENAMNRDQLLTVGDLENFKVELLAEITRLLQDKSATAPKEWLRTSEIREMLGVSAGTLQNLRITRKLSFTKINGIVFYKYQDVMLLLDENCIPRKD